MFDNIKKSLYFKRMYLLLKKGLEDGRIVLFDNEFYEKLSHTYISGLPVSIHIKYLKPSSNPGKCYDRSLYMFFCFDNAILVRGDNKCLEMKYGKQSGGHGWIEMNNYVYDPSLMMRFDKDLYYEIYKPSIISKYTKEKYCSIKSCKELYDEIKNTTISDFKTYGKKRIELSLIIPLVMDIAKKSANQEFIDELNKFITLIDYDEEEISNELNEAFNKKINTLRLSK